MMIEIVEAMNYLDDCIDMQLLYDNIEERA